MSFKKVANKKLTTRTEKLCRWVCYNAIVVCQMDREKPWERIQKP